MSNSNSTYRFTFQNGYCAGAMTRAYLKPGEASEGRETGTGWGATPAQAKRRAKANMKRSGNTNVEWVIGIERLYKNGVLISEIF